MGQYCCEMKEHCDISPEQCPIAKNNQAIAAFEAAKKALIDCIAEPFQKMVGSMEKMMSETAERIKNKMSGKIRKTQNEMILDYMAEFGSITPLDAVRDLGCMRLASRISDLKRQGYPIQSEFEPFTNRYGKKSHYKRYSLRDAPEGMN